MKERKQAFVRKETDEWIDDQTNEYVKNTHLEDGRYRFFFRFVQEHFTPCDKCQEKIHRLITESDNLFLGNKSYEPPIELSRFWDIIDDSWEELERRIPTKEDFIKIYGYGKGEDYWEGYLKETKGE